MGTALYSKYSPVSRPTATDLIRLLADPLLTFKYIKHTPQQHEYLLPSPPSLLIKMPQSCPVYWNEVLVSEEVCIKCQEQNRNDQHQIIFPSLVSSLKHHRQVLMSMAWAADCRSFWSLRFTKFVLFAVLCCRVQDIGCRYENLKTDTVGLHLAGRL